MATKAEGRNYDKEYTDYYGRPGHINATQRKHRRDKYARGMARALMAKQGKVRKGDGKDVDHKNGNPQDNRHGNLQVMSKSANRAKH
jgi:hypothetical protein